MSDLISRQAAIDAIVKHSYPVRYDFGFTSIENGMTVTGIRQALNELPSAEPEPSQVARDIANILENEKDMRVISERKTGRWILVKGSNGKDYHKCSCCLHTQEITGVKNYCSVCGADMMEVEHE